MTKDRLKELQKTTPWSRVSYQRISRQIRIPEAQNAPADATTPFMAIELDAESNVAEFLAQIDLIRILIDKIEEFADEIREIHTKMLDPMADAKLGQVLDDKTADIKNLAYDVSNKLKKLEQAQTDEADEDKASALWRIKETQIFTITRRFREVMNAYNQEFVLHRDRCKRVIKRELEITGNRRNDDELEDMLQNGFPGTFNFTIMVDVEKARQAVNEIEARHRDIAKLEESIRELHSMFADLAMLVTTQGEMIDNIEHNVSKTVEYVGDAAVQVHEAHVNHRAAMKKKIIIAVILIAVVLIFLLIFSAYVTTQRKLFGR